jgi:SLT domain-containing protein
MELNKTMSNKWRGYSSLINGGKTTKKGVLRIMEKKDEWVWFIYRERVFSKWGE